MRGLEILEGTVVPIPKGGEDQARIFWRLFGFREVMKPAGEKGIWLQHEGKTLALKVTDPFEPVRDKPSAVILVDDVEGYRKQFTAKRARVLDSAVLPGWRRFVVLDPFQNRVEVRAKAREGMADASARELDAGFPGSADRL
ncbi:MAG TPA: glyoxalase [Candidatus Thermoplasmatota archaeon]|nr:glyoxalase [Candidatus Thermoplasmatota archaeon]